MVNVRGEQWLNFSPLTLPLNPCPQKGWPLQLHFAHAPKTIDNLSFPPYIYTCPMPPNWLRLEATYRPYGSATGKKDKSWQAMVILENHANNEVGRRAWKSFGLAPRRRCGVRPCSFGGQQPQRRCSGGSAAAAAASSGDGDGSYHDGDRVIEVCNLNRSQWNQSMSINNYDDGGKSLGSPETAPLRLPHSSLDPMIMIGQIDLFVSFHSLKNKIIVGIFITIKVKSALYPFQWQ